MIVVYIIIIINYIFFCKYYKQLLILCEFRHLNIIMYTMNNGYSFEIHTAYTFILYKSMDTMCITKGIIFIISAAYWSYTNVNTFCSVLFHSVLLFLLQ